MKFPMRERPFTRVALSPAQCAEYEALLATVVDATLDERERFVHLDNRTLSKKLWKAVKNREDVTVFKRLGRELPATRATPRQPPLEQPAERYNWRMPKLIAVGTIAGDLDDIMYGIVTPDAPTIAVKTSYVNDELVDSAVLHEMRGATHDDPFQFTGLKWMVKAHAASINAVVWPRDFVFVESTGVRTYRHGARVGFHAMHSVELPQCRELEALGILRGRFSACYLYSQRNPGTVEVYSMTFVEPGGNAPETIAVMSAANTMIGMWKSVWCAQNKKLSWLLENDAARRRFRAASSLAAAAASADKRCCHLCSKAFHSFRKVTGCMLCSAWVCSRCRIARSLSAANESLVLSTRVVEVCKSCIAHVAVADAFAIASDQYVACPVATAVEPASDEAVAKPKSLERCSDDRLRECSTDSSATLPSSLTSLGNFERVRSWRDTEDVEPQNRSRETSEADSVVMETIEDWEEQQHQRAASSTTSFRPAATGSVSSEADEDAERLDHHQVMLRKMQSLCMAAEETYQITSLNASRVLDTRTAR